ncbi:hypothetical protein SEUCBS140593_010214 [Sporothrix eucalyptigena]|uniref:Xylanolytic transcriptional activator regulatory domain-containing protein n=1 Tax=Sporothrix eucalyptigena TaxID=1812306 RepID=A0ABP0D160_9PEZI
MVVGALQFVDNDKLPESLSSDEEHVQKAIEKARRRVVVEATGGLFIENLQALIIIAFNDLGNDEPSCATWIEEEERRRVFWNVFALDRTCSVMTGWSVGLTGDNVSCRLPICGTHWNDDEMQAQAPFFEIWDTSAAKTSNSIAFLPAHYSSPGQANEGGDKGPGGSGDGVDSGSGVDMRNQVATSANCMKPRGQGPQMASGPIDKSAVGAFSYYIESLEWLSRIFTYYLKPRVNFKDPEEVSSWLTRFKELDLDLVHWKMFLPTKWKDPSVPPPETANFLDPNMSLAHVTHNTSMILLHQRIAYPDAHQYALQRLKVRLPSDYSAETCQLAAIGTADITRGYLASAPTTMAVSPHFAFCAFVSAKLLLVHSQYYKTQLDPRFDILLECIRQIAGRWQGNKGQTSSTLAARFKRELVWLCRRCQEDSNIRISVLSPLESSQYTNASSRGNDGGQDLDGHLQGAPDLFSPGYRNGKLNGGFCGPHQEPSATASTPSTSTGEPVQSPYYGQTTIARGLVATGLPGLSINSAQNSVQSVDSVAWMHQVNAHDGLSNILDSLTDTSFMDLDRIISFEDAYPAVGTVPAGSMVGVPQAEEHGWAAPGYS